MSALTPDSLLDQEKETVVVDETISSPSDQKKVRTTAQSPAATPIKLAVIATVPETILSFMVDQIRFLTENGFEVHTITSPGMSNMPGNERLNSIRHEIPMKRTIKPLADFVALVRLFHLLREIRPTIVQTRTPKAGLLGMIAAWFAGVPIRMYTVDGLPILTQKFPSKWILAATDWLACTLATEVLCVSRSVRRFLVSTRLCPSKKARVLGDGCLSGVDIAKFDPHSIPEAARSRTREQYSIPENAFVLGYIGRLVPDKGVAELAAAWREIRSEFAGVHLLLCGYFETMHPVAAELARELESDPRVHITGKWLNDMPPIYTAIDICLLPTYREGLSTVAIESAAMEVPIVSTRVPGCVDAIRNGVTGILVEPRDAQALAIAIRRFLKDRQLREQMGAAARDFVSRHFSAHRTSALVFAEYQRLIADLADRDGTPQPQQPAKPVVAIADSSARRASSAPIHPAA